LNSQTIPPGQSLFIHFNNDASASNEINASTVGSFASPLDSGAFGLQLYFSPVSFGNGATIADHIQWSIDGEDNTSADERSDEAEAGGVWVDQSAWVSTSTNTEFILLTDATSAELHSPADYLAVPDFNIESIEILSNGNVRLAWQVPNHTEVVVLATTNLLDSPIPVGTNSTVVGMTALTAAAYTNEAVDSAQFFTLQSTIGM